MAELKLCPFCGGEAKIQEIRNGYQIKCLRCGIAKKQKVLRFPLEWLYAKMVDHWNTRNDEAARQEEREAIDAKIQETISRYQTECVAFRLRQIRESRIGGLRTAQEIIRERGEK